MPLIAVPGLPISNETDSKESVFSHMQPGVSGFVPVGLPSICLPSTLATSSALISLHASMAVAAGAAEDDALDLR